MGDVSAGFNRQDKVARCALIPALKGGFCGQVVEGIVNFDRMEMAAVKFESFPLAELFRVENPPPVFVNLSRSPDMIFHGFPTPV